MAFVRSLVRLAKKSIKSRLDYSKYPKLDAAEVTESVSKGSGPGGQSVATSSNAVRLLHEPTRVAVKCHETRSREKNREIALRRLHEAVDLHLNGEDSVSRQVARLEAEQKRRRKETRAKHREEKAAAKQKASEETSEVEEVEEEQIVDFGGVRINDPVKLLQLRPPLQRMSQEASLNFVRAMKSTESVSNGEEAPTESTGTFVLHVNPMTSRSEWRMQAADYDYQQEVARAAFADMLHDSERNRLYYDGLRSAISELRGRGDQVHVLDIGTGTGLLSMMAATIGADSITAIEEFPPIADCAQKVIAANGFADKIKLVRKRSTKVEVGPGLDMARRANLLVTEVFDTELIGEAAIATFNHAHKNLLTEDCLVVPTHGTVFAQVVSSDLASRWNRIHPISLGSAGELLPPSDTASSSCSLALHDLQLSQMRREWFEPVTDPVAVFEFDFSGKSGPIPCDEQTVSKVKSISTTSGPSSAVFMWWELKMDPARKITLSCAPHWGHPKGTSSMPKQVPSSSSSSIGFSHDDKTVPWRDHWMQSVYYPVSGDLQNVSSGEELCVVSNHDEFSLWFDVRKEAPEKRVQMPSPTAGIHLAASRNRLGQINDPERNAKFVAALTTALEGFTQPPTCLCLTELSLLPLIACRLGAARCFVAEESVQMRRVMESVARANGIAEDRIVFLDKAVAELDGSEWGDAKIDLIVAEPNFSMNLLPWHNLLYWYCLKHVSASKGITEETKVMPRSAELWALPVKFEDLWKIRSPLHAVEGFDMKHFDDIIMGACDAADANVEPQPLWEYPTAAAAAGPIKLLDFDFSAEIPEEDVKREVCIESVRGDVNGMAFWMVWNLDGVNSVSSGGPVGKVKVGENVDWDVHSKQGVMFFKKPREEKIVCKISGTATFKPKEGDVVFHFEPVPD